MREIQLRPYQKKFIDEIRREFARLKHEGKKLAVVGVAPCGAGKTVIAAQMTRQSVERGKWVIFFVHRDELIAQTARTFYKLDIPFGVIASGQEMKLDRPVQIASVQTLARRLSVIPKPDFLICDECHHILAKTYKEILDAFPKAYLLGVTATPQRMGGVNLGDVFDGLVQSLSVKELIELGNLTPFKYWAPDIGVNLDDVKIHHGEYDMEQLATVMKDKKITGGIVDNYFELAGDKQAICYCVNVEHSISVAEAFNDAGIRAEHIDGNTPKNRRAYLVDKFRQGKIKVLCNCNLFGEGFDVPKCQAVILARPTRSLTLHVQQSMRSMRPDADDPEKVAIIIDHVQNYTRHGLPDDPRFWSLAMKKVRCPQCCKLVIPFINDDGYRECPECHKLIDEVQCPKCGKPVVPFKNKDGRLECPKCHYIFPKGEAVPHGKPDVHEYDGELVEISQARLEQQLKYFSVIASVRGYERGWIYYKTEPLAVSYEDYQLIGKTCGYEPGWAWHKWQEKKALLGK